VVAREQFKANYIDSYTKEIQALEAYYLSISPSTSAASTQTTSAPSSPYPYEEGGSRKKTKKSKRKTRRKTRKYKKKLIYKQNK
jgi:hypothetical protein